MDNMDKIEVVKNLLTNYKHNKAFADKLLMDMMKHEVQLKYHQTGSLETREDIIKGLCLSSKVIDDMPFSVTNKFNSLTENAALNYLYYLTPSQLEIKAIQSIIDEKKQSYTKFYEQIYQVENLLEHLSEKQRTIIELRFLKGYTSSESMVIHRLQSPEFGTYNLRTFKIWIKQALRVMANYL